MTVRALTPNGLGIPEAALMPSSSLFFSTFPNSGRDRKKNIPQWFSECSNAKKSGLRKFLT
jgi:hypothetical protein